MNYIITEKQFDELQDETTLTVSRQKELTLLISKRIDYILETITSKLNWWDFLTGGDWDDESDGLLSESLGGGEISLRGEFRFKPNYILDENSIPERWLWQDFEKEFEKSVKDFKEKESEKREKAKLARQDKKKNFTKLQKSILSKLTKEELASINFISGTGKY